MKYLKVVMILLFIVLLGLGSYYLYLLLGPSKSGKTGGSDSERPFLVTTGKDGDGKVVSKITDYTSADVESGKAVGIQGKFQSGDPVQEDINGVAYVYVIGVLSEDNSLAKIWLTQVEYEKIRNLVEWEKGSIAPGQPVLITITRDAISIEKSKS